MDFLGKHVDGAVESLKIGGLSMETVVVSSALCENDPYGATNMPIYQTATFQQKGATEFGDYDYTRSGNPTRTALQDQLAKLEGVDGSRAFCFTTGMAAISTVTRLAKAGDEIIVNEDSYGGVYRLMSQIVVRHGIKVTYVNLSGKDGHLALQSKITAATRLVFIESPTNPIQKICDIRSLSKVCHDNNSLLVIDNTMMSPVLCRPLTIGADIVVHSGTKFISGHSDTMAGVVITTNTMYGEKTLGDWIYFFQNAEGTGLAPFDCWLLLRGVKTLPLRVREQQRNADAIARWLKDHNKVTCVYYAALEDHPDRDLHFQQASGAGTVICFLTGDVALSEHIVTVTKLFKITVSFGSVSSSISIPCKMSHASIPDEVKTARAFPVDLVRLSVGIEDPDDLIRDLQNAFDSFI